jgi:hypothetical protein
MKPEEAFVKNVRQVLEQDLATFDPDLGARLSRARHATFDKAGSRSRFWRPGLWLPAVAGGMAAIVFAVSFSLYSPAPPVATAYAEDLEILATTDPLEFYEDLEFFAWLDETSRPES